MILFFYSFLVFPEMLSDEGAATKECRLGDLAGKGGGALLLTVVIAGLDGSTGAFMVKTWALKFWALAASTGALPGKVGALAEIMGASLSNDGSACKGTLGALAVSTGALPGKFGALAEILGASLGAEGSACKDKLGALAVST
jgi:hypothetical protein